MANTTKMYLPPPPTNTEVADELGEIFGWAGISPPVFN